MCTRSIEQIGCINKTLSKFIPDPGTPTLVTNLCSGTVFTNSVHQHHPNKASTNKRALFKLALILNVFQIVQGPPRRAESLLEAHTIPPRNYM